MVKRLILFSLSLIVCSPLFGSEAKTCPIKSIKQRIEFFIGSNIQSEKISQPREISGITIYFEKKPQLSNEDIETVSGLRVESGNNQMNIEFTKMGALKLEKITKENIGRYMPIVVDNIIVSAPVIQSPIAGGLVTVSFPVGKQVKSQMSKVCP